MAQLQDTDIDGNLTVTGKLTNKGTDVLTKINNDFTKFQNMFCTEQSLEFEATPGTNYTVTNDPSVTLTGNRLRISTYVTRSSSTDRGNITNERIMTFAINHGGKISTCYNASALTYYSGQVNSYAAVELTPESDTVMKIGINLTATNAASTTARTIITMSCSLNPDCY